MDDGNNKSHFEAFIRDYVLENSDYYGSDTVSAAKDLANEIGAVGVNGDVYYTDSGLAWEVGDQLDVYRFIFNSTGNNADVGTYEIRIEPDGIFGTDPITLKYTRKGPATKVLEVKEAK